MSTERVVKVAPSLLAADLMKLEREVRMVEEGGADLIHLDVMDGLFVPAINFGSGWVSALRKITPLPIDVHLMLERPERSYKDFISAGADLVTIHLEASCDIPDLLKGIRERGARPGIAIKPATPAGAVRPFLKEIDLVLVMLVEPGFSFQKMIPETVEKVKEVRAILDRAGSDAELEVDGGIDTGNAGTLRGAGASILASGGGIFLTRDYSSTIKTMKGSPQERG